MILPSWYHLRIGFWYRHSVRRLLRLDNWDELFSQGFLKWYSRLYRNQGSLLFGPGAADWGEQIVLITGGGHQLWFTLRLQTTHTGASGIGELLANTLAVRNVTVVVLDVKPIVTENCTDSFSNSQPSPSLIMFQSTSIIINAMSQDWKRSRK